MGLQMSHFSKLINRRFIWEANQVDPAEADQKVDHQVVQKEALPEEEVKAVVEDGQVQQATLQAADVVMPPVNNI